MGQAYAGAASLASPKNLDVDRSQGTQSVCGGSYPKRSPTMPTALTISLEDEDLASLDRYIAQQGGGQVREDVAAQLLRERLRSGGHPQQDEGLRPDELNASNDS
jgi:hypothetical protein